MGADFDGELFSMIPGDQRTALMYAVRDAFVLMHKHAGVESLLELGFDPKELAYMLKALDPLVEDQERGAVFLMGLVTGSLYEKHIRDAAEQVAP